MTDRRRNIFVLLLVVGLLIGVARRRRGEADAAGPRPQGRRLADLPGQADEAVDGQQRRDQPHARHHARARRPARRRRAGDPALRPGPDRRLAPGRQERRRGGATRSARRRRCTSTTGRRTSSAPDCKPAPADANVTGGPSAGTGVGALTTTTRSRAPPSAPSATSRARRPPTGSSISSTQDEEGPRRPGRDARGTWRRRRRTRASSPARTRRSSRSSPARSSSAHESPNDKTKSDQFYVLQDKPALGGTDIKNPKQNFDNGAGRHRPADRHLRLHGQGPHAVAEDHARDRPARQPVVHPGQRPADRLPALRDRARQRADLGAVHRLPAEPGRHRRRATARRSRAASRSSRPSTWRTC